MISLFKRNPNLAIGLLTIALGCIILFVWIPADVETGLFEKVRSRVRLGDALAPSIAAALLIFAGLLLFFQSLRANTDIELSFDNMKYLLLLFCLFVVTINVMHWSGTWIVETAKLLGILNEESSYRLLRDSAPWKYIGYVTGGLFMLFSLICLMERKFSLKAMFIALAAVVTLILIYDVPFDNILLPPNGDF
ncbi:hypothetical protein [Amphritea sp.]|uniref:hypothetical protein n=1 Tax=Amphritea sp. TaxID=1872502 RepID=UPI003A8D91F9